MRRDLAPGTKLGRYAIESKIGQGGMGAVYRALDETLGRKVALKVIAPDHARDPRFLERFRREGQAAAAVRHPHVLACHEVGEQDGLHFLALELATGGSLSERLRKGALPWREAARIGAEIARALEALHAREIVHRDLKPANVLFDEEGRAKVCDFGLARDDLVGSALTKTGEVLGTVTYMAPEQCEGGRHAGPPADLYALGGTLYALVFGEPPFPGTGPDVIAKHIAVVPPRLDANVPGTPRALADLVAALLRKDPEQRPTARVAAERLEAIARGRTEERSRARVAAAVVFVVLLGGTLILTRPRPAAPPPAAPPTVPSVPIPHGRDDHAGAPPWCLALPRDKRPPLPLPKHVSFGARPGEYVNDVDGSVLLFIPAGKTYVGTDVKHDFDWDSPRHAVELSSFFIGKYEVTIEQFAAFVASTHHVTLAERPGTPTQQQAHDLMPRYVPLDKPNDNRVKVEENIIDQKLSWRSPSRWPLPADTARLPVVQVSHGDALEYARWARLTLPTEAQWERAASGQQGKEDPAPYPWGSEHPKKRARPPANLADERLRALDPLAPWGDRLFDGYDDGYATIAPVGSFPDDVSPDGALDVLGNVRELTLDTFYKAAYKNLNHVPVDPLETRSSEDPPAKVARGSSWLARVGDCRLTERGIAEYPQSVTGFRVARNVR